jgi:SAM-dependent methyltransferase
MNAQIPAVNYDAIAPRYHARYADNTLPGVAAHLRQLAQSIPAARVLEAGCGTGRWLTELEPLAASLIGLDYSIGMLRQARERSAAMLVHGEAGALPLAAGRFDLVYAVNALHHFHDPARFVAEARRLLRRGGALTMVGLDPHAGLDDWYIYDYFPETRALDLARYPSAGRQVDWLIASGFERVGWHTAEHIRGVEHGRALLDSHFIQKHSGSQLALLTQEQYQSGLARIHAALAAAEATGESLAFVSDLRLNAVTGYAP